MIVDVSQKDQAKKMSIFGSLQESLKTFLLTCKQEKLYLREYALFPFQLINIYKSDELLKASFSSEVRKYDKLDDFKNGSEWNPLVENSILLLEVLNSELCSPIAAQRPKKDVKLFLIDIRIVIFILLRDSGYFKLVNPEDE